MSITRWEVGDGWGTYPCDSGHWVIFDAHEAEVQALTADFEACIAELKEKLCKAERQIENLR